MLRTYSTLLAGNIRHRSTPPTLSLHRVMAIQDQILRGISQNVTALSEQRRLLSLFNQFCSLNQIHLTCKTIEEKILIFVETMDVQASTKKRYIATLLIAWEKFSNPTMKMLVSDFKKSLVTQLQREDEQQSFPLTISLLCQLLSRPLTLDQRRTIVFMWIIAARWDDRSDLPTSRVQWETELRGLVNLNGYTKMTRHASQKSHRSDHIVPIPFIPLPTTFQCFTSFEFLSLMHSIVIPQELLDRFPDRREGLSLHSVKTGAIHQVTEMLDPEDDLSPIMVQRLARHEAKCRDQSLTGTSTRYVPNKHWVAGTNRIFQITSALLAMIPQELRM